MGGCHGRSALGEGDEPYEKSPKASNSFRKQKGKHKHPKSSIHTYPIDMPILIQDSHENHRHSKHNGHAINTIESSKDVCEAEQVCLISPDFPSYGPDVSRSESCDPDTPQPHDAESSPSCGDHNSPDSPDSPELDSPDSPELVFPDSPELDSALPEAFRPIPMSDSGICSLCMSSQETTPTAFSSPQSDGAALRTAIAESKTIETEESSLLDISTKSAPVVSESYTPTLYPGSLDNICEDRGKPVPPSNLPVKRFHSHHGLPPQRPQSETKFSFKRLRKRKSGAGGRNSIRGSWRSQDSFDINCMLKTGLSRANSECSEMCLFDDLYNIQAPLAQFDSILTVDSASRGSLNRLPHDQSVKNVIEEPSGQVTCIVCKGENSRRQSQRNSWSEQLRYMYEGESTSSPVSEGPVSTEGDLEMLEEAVIACIDGKDLVVLDVETYNHLLSDLAQVKVKLQRIYNLLLQEEFDSISDIINNSGLETCLLDT